MKSSKEQEEAIKYFENKIKDVKPEYIETYVDGKLIRSETISLKMRFDKEDADKMQTVLSMLKEKDAKIEHLEEKRENQKAELAILNEKQKEMNKLINTVSSYKGMFKKEQKENEKKDKIIDLMAEYIARGDIEEDICIEKLDECDSMALGECENCIKQYFERKSEE